MKLSISQDIHVDLTNSCSAAGIRVQHPFFTAFDPTPMFPNTLPSQGSQMRSVLIFLLTAFGLTGCGPAANHFNQKGAEAFGRQDLLGAKENFKRAVLLEGKNPVFHNNLGYDLYLLKDYDGAEAEYTQALSRSPNESLTRQIYMDQAMLYCDGAAGLSQSHKDWNAKGIQVLKELIAPEEDNADLHMKLGFAYFRASNPGGGFMELDKAVQLATPAIVARFTKDAVEGSLMVLRQVQQFYAQVRLFKKAKQVQAKITKIEKDAKPYRRTAPEAVSKAGK